MNFFDDMGIIYRGLILGIMIAAPVGPIGLLCIRRTMRFGFPTGFATGLGAATADALFGAIAAFGVAAILGLLTTHQTSLTMLGGVVLLVMAWFMWKERPKPPVEEITTATVIKAYVSGLALTCANPVTIFAILAVVATLGGDLPVREAAILTLGIFLGSLAWWVFLCGGVRLLRQWINEQTAQIINRVTAVLLVVAALWAVGLSLYTILTPAVAALPA